ncbi:Solute carrier family 23 member 1-like 3, partial [Homarus americanus]
AIGALLRWISPLVIVPTVTLIGFSLYPVAASKASSHWGIASMTIVLLVLFSQYLSEVALPGFTWSRERGFTRINIYVFKLFPWGLPTVSVAGVLGMLAGVLASIVESVGDYFACARLSGAPAPPKHAINRGIWIEGLGTILAGLWGTGSGTTSYSQNVGAIGVTKVGSRRGAVQRAAIMPCVAWQRSGLCSSPSQSPSSAASSVCSSASVGSTFSTSTNLQELIGFFFGMALPMWMAKPENLRIIQTSVPMLDQVLSVLLKTSMFVGGCLGFFLDNTIPGTDEERGMVAWKDQLKPPSEESAMDHSCYNLPVGMDTVRRWNWTRYVPISPTFIGWGFVRKRCMKSSA